MKKSIMVIGMVIVLSFIGLKVSSVYKIKKLENKIVMAKVENIQDKKNMNECFNLYLNSTGEIEKISKNLYEGYKIFEKRSDKKFKELKEEYKTITGEEINPVYIALKVDEELNKIKMEEEAKELLDI